MQGSRVIAQDHTCPICLTVYLDPVSLSECKHIFCRTCVMDSAEATNSFRCPLCRRPFIQSQLIHAGDLAKTMQKLYSPMLEERRRRREMFQGVKFIVGNRTVRHETEEKNKYEWTVYLRNVVAEPLNKTVQRVEFELHETFNPRVVSLQPEGREVKVTRWGWGTFRIEIKVFWRNNIFQQAYSTFYHDLAFDPVVEKVVTAKVIRRSK